MTEERRAAPRKPAPEGIEATVLGIRVEVIDLSLIGARIEHTERFPLTSPQLVLRWQGRQVTIPFRAMRSQIVARRGSGLVYETGVQFLEHDATADGMIASILHASLEPPPAARPAPPPAREPRPELSFDDSFIRRVRFLKDESEEDLPYASFRFVEGKWQKEYVASPDQPADGFTLRRGDLKFDEMQRTFEVADEDTRRMMRVALESQLKSA